MIRALAAALLAAVALVAGPPAPAATPAKHTGNTCCSPTPHLTPTAHTLRILALGDSITLGNGSSTGAGYRSPLRALLGDHAIHIGPDGTRPLRHAGRSGWCIHQWTPLARDLAAAYAPNVVLVHLGTNDAGRDHNEPAHQMLNETRQLIDALRAGRPNVPIVLAAPTITTINTPAQQQALNTFDDQLAALAATYSRVWTVDMRSTPANPLPLGDGVHPDNAGYAAMAQRWYEALRKAGLV